MNELLEELTNGILQGTVDFRIANAIVRLAEIFLKSIDQDTARASAEAIASSKSQLCAKRLYLPLWRRENIETLERAAQESLKAGLP